MIRTEIKNVSLEFETNDTVFSPTGIDKGTAFLLEQVEFQRTDKVLDLGCGYGVIGILASKYVGEENVVMCDNLDEAIALSQVNAVKNNVPNIKIVKSDGLDSIEDQDFTLIISNPPYNMDYSVPKKFIEMSYKKMAVGGKIIMVTKRMEWFKNKMTSVYGGAKVIEGNGYAVIISEKRLKKAGSNQKNIHGLSKKLQRKQTKMGKKTAE